MNYYPDGLTKPVIKRLLAEMDALGEQPQPTSRLLGRDMQARHERRVVAARTSALVRVLPHASVDGVDLNEVA
jgi:hypothetical protein